MQFTCLDQPSASGALECHHSPPPATAQRALGNSHNLHLLLISRQCTVPGRFGCPWVTSALEILIKDPTKSYCCNEPSEKAGAPGDGGSLPIGLQEAQLKLGAANAHMQIKGVETNNADGVAGEVLAACTSTHRGSARVDHGPSSPNCAQGAQLRVSPHHTSSTDVGVTGSSRATGEGTSPLEGCSTGDSKSISIGEHIPGECGQDERWSGEESTPTSKEAAIFSFVKAADSPDGSPLSSLAQTLR